MPDDKPMTPEEFAKRLAADKYISLTYEQRIAMKLSEWAESIRRDAKREAAIYCYDAAKGPYVDWNKIIAYIQSLSSAPIDTPPAAAEEDYGVPGATMSRMTAEAVCPRCEGRKTISVPAGYQEEKPKWKHPPCPDCHGTGKRADAKGKQ